MTAYLLAAVAFVPMIVEARLAARHERVLRAAGLEPGTQGLDVGSGAGHVALSRAAWSAPKVAAWASSAIRRPSATHASGPRRPVSEMPGSSLAL